MNDFKFFLLISFFSFIGCKEGKSKTVSLERNQPITYKKISLQYEKHKDILLALEALAELKNEALLIPKSDIEAFVNFVKKNNYYIEPFGDHSQFSLGKITSNNIYENFSDVHSAIAIYPIIENHFYFIEQFTNELSLYEYKDGKATLISDHFLKKLLLKALKSKANRKEIEGNLFDIEELAFVNILEKNEILLEVENKNFILEGSKLKYRFNSKSLDFDLYKAN